MSVSIDIELFIFLSPTTECQVKNVSGLFPFWAKGVQSHSSHFSSRGDTITKGPSLGETNNFSTEAVYLHPN